MSGVARQARSRDLEIDRKSELARVASESAATHVAMASMAMPSTTMTSVMLPPVTTDDATNPAAACQRDLERQDRSAINQQLQVCVAARVRTSLSYMLRVASTARYRSV